MQVACVRCVVCGESLRLLLHTVSVGERARVCARACARACARVCESTCGATKSNTAVRPRSERIKRRTGLMNEQSDRFSEMAAAIVVFNVARRGWERGVKCQRACEVSSVNVRGAATHHHGAEVGKLWCQARRGDRWGLACPRGALEADFDPLRSVGEAPHTELIVKFFRWIRRKRRRRGHGWGKGELGECVRQCESATGVVRQA